MAEPASEEIDPKPSFVRPRSRYPSEIFRNVEAGSICDNEHMLRVQTSSAINTQQLASNIGKRLKSADILLLSGPLGSGKSTFVQGLAEGVGVTVPVTSPTFTLVHEYPAKDFKLFHIDSYRLDSPEQIVELGFDEWLEQDAVLVVEWTERLGPLTPEEYLLVKLEIVGEEERRITLEPHGAGWEKLVRELEAGGC